MSHSLVPRDAIAFQNDLDEVLAEPPPRVLQATNLLLAGLLMSVICIAAIVKTDIVVAGRGAVARRHADNPDAAGRARHHTRALREGRR